MFHGVSRVVWFNCHVAEPAPAPEGDADVLVDVLYEDPTDDQDEDVPKAAAPAPAPEPATGAPASQSAADSKPVTSPTPSATPQQPSSGQKVKAIALQALNMVKETVTQAAAAKSPGGTGAVVGSGGAAGKKNARPPIVLKHRQSSDSNSGVVTTQSPKVIMPTAATTPRSNDVPVAQYGLPLPVVVGKCVVCVCDFGVTRDARRSDPTATVRVDGFVRPVRPDDIKVCSGGAVQLLLSLTHCVYCAKPPGVTERVRRPCGRWFLAGAAEIVLLRHV